MGVDTGTLVSVVANHLDHRKKMMEDYRCSYPMKNPVDHFWNQKFVASKKTGRIKSHPPEFYTINNLMDVIVNYNAFSNSSGTSENRYL